MELLTLIAFFACTDGGPTGCTLALVSKRIRAASRPARFYSVALFGSPEKIEQFLTCYEAERARATEALPRVRHLCLSLFGKGLDTSGGSSTPPPMASSRAVPGPLSAGQPMSRAEFFAAMQRRTQHWRSTQDNLDEHYNRVVPTLIRAVAADVKTLALIQAQWRCASVVRCAFPSLRELTVVGGDPTFLPFAFVPSGRPLYPALKRLHHILAFVQKDVDMLNWAKHAPNVTHLRVSRVDYHPRITVDSLNEVISKSCRLSSSRRAMSNVACRRDRVRGVLPASAASHDSATSGAATGACEHDRAPCVPRLPRLSAADQGEGEGARGRAPAAGDSEDGAGRGPAPDVHPSRET